MTNISIHMLYILNRSVLKNSSCIQNILPDRSPKKNEKIKMTKHTLTLCLDNKIEGKWRGGKGKWRKC